MSGAMGDGLPPYYFRVRENGATVFRVDAEDRQRRLEMEQVAVINLTAHWAQALATDAALDEVAEPLLLAMHDLRTVLVRRRAERLGRAEGRMEGSAEGREDGPA